MTGSILVFPAATMEQTSAYDRVKRLHPGMTLRDWFAGQTLASLAGATPQERAKFAYQTADAMLAVRASNAQ